MSYITTAEAAARYGFPNRQSFREWAELNGVILIRRGRKSRTLIVSPRDIDAQLLNSRTGQPLSTHEKRRLAG